MTNTIAQQRYDSRLVLRKPLVTEKSANANAAKSPVFTFLVDPRANKGQIVAEIKKLYKVSPVKVNIVNTFGKTVAVRGRLGKKADYKKAMVYLKAGDTINFS